MNMNNLANLPFAGTDNDRLSTDDRLQNQEDDEQPTTTYHSTFFERHDDYDGDGFSFPAEEEGIGMLNGERGSASPSHQNQSVRSFDCTIMPPATAVTNDSNSVSSVASAKKKLRKNHFPVKLYNILECAENDKELRKIISWLPDGSGFKIHSTEAFQSTVMQKYFRNQTKFKSFTRQLYIYGFSKVGFGLYFGAFIHPYFTRGYKEEAAKIVRHRDETGSLRSIRSSGGIGDSSTTNTTSKSSSSGTTTGRGKGFSDRRYKRKWHIEKPHLMEDVPSLASSSIFGARHQTFGRMSLENSRELYFFDQERKGENTYPTMGGQRGSTSVTHSKGKVEDEDNVALPTTILGKANSSVLEVYPSSTSQHDGSCTKNDKESRAVTTTGQVVTPVLHVPATATKASRFNHPNIIEPYHQGNESFGQFPSCSNDRHSTSSATSEAPFENQNYNDVDFEPRSIEQMVDSIRGRDSDDNDMTVASIMRWLNASSNDVVSRP